MPIVTLLILNPASYGAWQIFRPGKQVPGLTAPLARFKVVLIDYSIEDSGYLRLSRQIDDGVLFAVAHLRAQIHEAFLVLRFCYCAAFDKEFERLFLVLIQKTSFLLFRQLFKGIILRNVHRSSPAYLMFFLRYLYATPPYPVFFAFLK